MLPARAIYLLCTIIITALNLTLSFAQQKWEDVVYLHNGSIIRGTLSAPQPADKVKIESNRNVWIFDNQEVLRVVQERISPYWAKRGHYNLTELGVLAGSSALRDNDQEQAFQFQMINGYRFHHLFAVGLGIGLNFYQKDHVFPMFADLRGDLFNGPLSPHYYLQGGYSLPLGSNQQLDQWSGLDVELDGGWLYGGGMGLIIHTRSSASWLFSLGYRIQKRKTHYPDWGGTRITDQLTYRRISVQVGMMF